MKTMTAGTIVAVTSLPVPGGEAVSGLYELVEYEPYEPSNYVWSPTWVIAPVGDESEEACVWVDAEDLFAQLDPRAYGALLADERAMSIAAELAEEMSL